MVGEGAEFGGVFAGDDLGTGIDAGFEGIGTGGILPSEERGLADFWALRRLAPICLGVLIYQG
ncbi:MAG TPA: hypothetical protein VKU19_36850 [Bryobacteraceae bacterium]|nr:hypothetical protein [Bryobacteraceae bacterium]